MIFLKIETSIKADNGLKIVDRSKGLFVKNK